jgi:hypothetical protein
MRGLFDLFVAMKTQFDIVLSLKTPQGFVEYGQYFIGNDREAACLLFEKLRGSRSITDHAVLHFDLLETENELPVSIKSLCCTLDELGWNCKQIAREVFRLRNIKEVAL